MQKVKVFSLPETIEEKSTFRVNVLRRELVVSLLTQRENRRFEQRASLKTSIFP